MREQAAKLFEERVCEMEIKKQIRELQDELINLRRDFHMHPELGFEEFRTNKVVSEYLTGCGLEVETVAKTGVVALLRGGLPGPTVMLRADMDGLPVREENEVPYKSLNEGKMHACGHDGHMAMLLVAAKILSGMRQDIAGNIKFVFQPNEEDAGARIMINEGVMENPKVEAVFGIHLWTPLKSGQLGIAGGAVMAAHENFQLKIKGKGGHSGTPQTAIDPILTAAGVIQAVQMIQTREIDVLKPTLIIFGKIQGGTAPNIIPASVEIEGSIRYLYDGNDDSEEQPKRRLERVIQRTCEAYRADYELKFIPSNPPLINDEALADMVRRVGEQIVGSERIAPYVCMPGEDFAEFQREAPGVFYFIGVGDKEKETEYPHHHPRFNIDEDMLGLGVEMHVRTALNYLTKRNN